MASTAARFMLFAWCFQRSCSQAPLQHAGKDCYVKCWKEPGFCDYCGVGNACCRKGDTDGPKECDGALLFKAPVTPTGKGYYHECVKAAFLPGQAPPVSVQAKGQVGALSEMQCVNYMAKKGCGWTQKYSCPGQQKGSEGAAHSDASMGYQCCCTNGLWKETATITDASDKDIAAATLRPPSQAVSTTYNPYGVNAASAFDVNANMGELPQTGPTGPTMIPSTADSGFAIAAAGGQQSGYDVAVPTIAPEQTGPQMLNDKSGANIHIEKLHLTDASFTPTEHHGPIYNQFSANTASAKRERCTFGICADLDTNDPGKMGVDTVHGVAMPTEAPGSSVQLPSYRVTMNGDNKAEVEKIENGVSSTVGNSKNAIVAPRIGDSKNGGMAQLTAAAAVGDLTLQVDEGAGFNIGDKITINDVETKRISNIVAMVQTGPTARRLQPVQMTLDSPLADAYPVGASVLRKMPAFRTAPGTKKAGDEGSSGSSMTHPSDLSGSADSSLFTSSDDSSLSNTSSGKTGAWLGMAFACLAAISISGCAGMFLMRNKKKKHKGGTDREAYLKNDFIERQPVYTDGVQETDPMMEGQEEQPAQPPPPAKEEAVQIQPTTSFPLQVTAPAVATMSYPYQSAVAPSIVSFPGMPNIGQSMLQTATPSVTYAAPQTTSYAAPQATSMYSNYAPSPSTYLSAPTAYSQVMAPQQNLGVTTGVSALPQTFQQYKS